MPGSIPRIQQGLNMSRFIFFFSYDLFDTGMMAGRAKEQTNDYVDRRVDKLNRGVSGTPQKQSFLQAKTYKVEPAVQIMCS